MMIALELALIAVLIVANGFLALSELAIVSARRSKLQTLANAGRRGSKRALRLSADPGRFLSTVQIGITLIGVMAGAFSGATIANRVSDWLIGNGLSVAWAEPLAFALVVFFITFLSVVAGELVPKQLALRDPERVALKVAPTMDVLSRFAAPVVSVLDMSGRAVLRLLGVRARTDQSITEEEIKTLVAEAQASGVVEPEERTMISSVLRLGDRSVRAIMTPRTEVEWLDLSRSRAEVFDQLVKTDHSRLLVGRGSVDDAHGVLLVKSALAELLQDRSLDVATLVVPPDVVPDSATALQAIDSLRRSAYRYVVVVDEYGAFEGILTPADILQAIAGSFGAEESAGAGEAVQRADGSWLIDGAMSLDHMSEVIGYSVSGEREYHTVAGLVLWSLKRLPQAGDSFDLDGWRFEVVDMDGKRIDKVLAEKLQTAAQHQAASI